jgi:hypothetical protein
VTNPDRVFHEAWLGMVQPAEGLVVSPTVLVRAQCFERRAKSVQLRFVELCTNVKGPPWVRSLGVLLEQLLGLTPDLFDAGSALPAALSLYVQEGKQTLRPTLALRNEGVAGLPANDVGKAAADDLCEATPEEDRVYAGLLTVLLRLVFLLYCEDHELLPAEHELFPERP